MVAASAEATVYGLAGSGLVASAATIAGVMARGERGCFISVMVAAALLLVAGWAVGEFLLDPIHGGIPACETWVRHLRLSTVSSALGMGCAGLAAVKILPGFFLPLGAGVLGVTALASLWSPGASIMFGVDLLLLAMMIGWLLVLRQKGGKPQ